MQNRSSKKRKQSGLWDCVYDRVNPSEKEGAYAMETTYYTFTAREIVVEGQQVAAAAGGPARQLLCVRRGAERAADAGDKIIDLAAWKFAREEEAGWSRSGTTAWTRRWSSPLPPRPAPGGIISAPSSSAASCWPPCPWSAPGPADGSAFWQCKKSKKAEFCKGWRRKSLAFFRKLPNTGILFREPGKLLYKTASVWYSSLRMCSENTPAGLVPGESPLDAGCFTCPLLSGRGISKKGGIFHDPQRPEDGRY